MKIYLYFLGIIFTISSCNRLINKSIIGDYKLHGSELYKFSIISKNEYSFQFIDYGYKKNDTIKNNGYFIRKGKNLFLTSNQKFPIDNSLKIIESYDKNLKDSVKIEVHYIDEKEESIDPFSNISSIEIDNRVSIPVGTKNPYTFLKKGDLSFFIMWHITKVEKKYYIKDKKSNVFKIYQDYSKGYNPNNKKGRLDIFDNEPVIIEKDKLILFKDVVLEKQGTDK